MLPAAEVDGVDFAEEPDRSAPPCGMPVFSMGVVGFWIAPGKVTMRSSHSL